MQPGSGSNVGGGLVRLLVSLAHLEGAWVTLRPLLLSHPLVGPDALVQVSSVAWVWISPVAEFRAIVAVENT